MTPLIAYIPARAGSKRIALKNIKPLAGQPVLARVVKAVRGFKGARAVCVSTDDARIARIAEKAGATVLALRARALSGDRVLFDRLLKQDVPRYLRHFHLKEDETVVLFILATAALVTPSLLRRAYGKFRAEKADILVATRRFGTSPFRALVQSGGRWKPLFPKKLPRRSQDLPDAQADAGLFYFLRYKRVASMKAHWFTNGRLACFPVSDAVAVDVDTPEDWNELERKFRGHGTSR